MTTHLWDEGAIPASSKAVVLSFLTSLYWVGVGGRPLFPLGLLVIVLMLGRITDANTWRGRVRFGKHALLAACAASALGAWLHTGLFLNAHGMVFTLL